MSVRRRKWRNKKTGAIKEAWMVHVEYRLPTGEVAEPIKRVSPVQTRRGAEEYERQIRQAMLEGSYFKQAVPTFEKWFNGTFWEEWVLKGKRPNKPSEKESKQSIFKTHLKDAFGETALDKIDEAAIGEFRAELQAKGLAPKTINNILAVLSKPLHFAAKRHIIPWAPDVGLLDVEPPEIEPWEFTEYVAFLAAAGTKGPMWFAAACLAGEGGLRIGEIKALDWKRDVDMVAKTITVSQQTRRGHTGTPKGRTRRTVQMTETLFEALRGLGRIRLGFVICNDDGTQKTDNEAKNVSYRVCKKAGLPLRGWHTLRHTFATDAARFGVNPWSLQRWLGHKRMEETQRYVDFATAHTRPIPEEVLRAGAGELDQDKKVLKMLGARYGTLTEHGSEAKSGQ